MMLKNERQVTSMVFIIESVVLCVIFTILILSQMKKPLGTILHSYPPAIVDRVIDLGLVEDKDRKTPSRVKAIKKKWPALIFLGILIGVFAYFVNGADTFLKGFAVSYGLWSVVDWYDAFILDIGWFCHSKKVKIPGTEDMEKDYKDYWFHIKGSLVGMVLGLPACFIAGLFCQIVGQVMTLVNEKYGIYKNDFMEKLNLQKRAKKKV